MFVHYLFYKKPHLIFTEFDSYEEKNRYWILFLLSLGPDNNVKKENLLKSLKGLQEKYFSKSPVSLNFSQSEMYDGVNCKKNN